MVLISAGDMSGSITSNVFYLTNFLYCAVQASWTGTPVGTLQVQASNDLSIWSNLTGASYSVSGAGLIMFGLIDAGYPFIRVIYTPSSSSGTLRVTVNPKGYGV